MKKIYHTTYEIINQINKKYYIGAHSTEDIYDLYYGSGERITRAVRKYGKGNFNKITTGVWKSQEIAYLMESWIVDGEVVADPNSYNLVPGGRAPLIGKRSATYGKKVTAKTKKNIKKV